MVALVISLVALKRHASHRSDATLSSSRRRQRTGPMAQRLLEQLPCHAGRGPTLCPQGEQPHARRGRRWPLRRGVGRTAPPAGDANPSARAGL